MGPERMPQEKDQFVADFSLESKVSAAVEMTEALNKTFIALGWSDEEFGGFYIALEEALANAVIHGNLRVKKEDGENLEAYDARMKEAEEAPENQAKKVAVHLEITSEEATITIRDEGQGFDPESIPDPTDDDALLGTSGRGVFLMRRCFDRVEFLRTEQGGTEVKLFKRRVSEGSV